MENSGVVHMLENNKHTGLFCFVFLLFSFLLAFLNFFVIIFFELIYNFCLNRSEQNVQAVDSCGPRSKDPVRMHEQILARTGTRDRSGRKQSKKPHRLCPGI